MFSRQSRRQPSHPTGNAVIEPWRPPVSSTGQVFLYRLFQECDRAVAAYYLARATRATRTSQPSTSVPMSAKAKEAPEGASNDSPYLPRR